MAFRMHPVRPSLHDYVGRSVDLVETLRPDLELLDPPLLRDTVSSLLFSEPVSDAIAPSSIAAVAVQAPASRLKTAVRGPTWLAPDGRNFTTVPTNLPTQSRQLHTLEAPQAIKASYLPHGVKIRASKNVVMCIRRHTRRGVLLALGKGGGYHNRPRRTLNSNVWC